MQWLGMVIAMVVVAESHLWVLCAQAEGGKVIWWVTGFVGGSGAVFTRWVLMSSAQLNGTWVQFVGGWVSTYTSPMVFSFIFSSSSPPWF